MNPTAAKASSEVGSGAAASDGGDVPIASSTSSESKTDDISNCSAVSTESNCLTPPPSNNHLKRIIHQVTPINPGQNTTETQSPVNTIRNMTTTPTSGSQKRVIRKITPIDPKKLQQAGLDRKIAEALSKQKSQQATNKTNNRILTPQPKATNTVVSAPNAIVNAEKSPKPLTPEQNAAPPVKPLMLAKNIIPPKITITAPDPPPEVDKPEMAGLNSQQRLLHVKNLLNKKLLQKKNSPNSDKTYQHLKPPAPLMGSPIASASSALKGQIKLPTNSSKPSTTHQTPPHLKGYSVLKESEMCTPPLPPFKAKTPQKSPQDIARKLDFQMEGELKVVHQQPAKRTYIKFNDPQKVTVKAVETQNKDNSEINVIPKAAIKAGQHPPQQPNDNLECNVAQSFRLYEYPQQKLNSPDKVSPRPTNMVTDYQQPTKEINKIPKATIKTGQQQQPAFQNMDSNFRFFQHNEQNPSNINLPELMPSKSPYMAANVGQLSAKANYQQQPLNATPNFRYFQNLEHKTDYPPHVISTKGHFSSSNMSHDYQTEYLKQQKINLHPKTTNAEYNEIPKAAIKAAGPNPQQYSYLPYSYKQLKQSEQKIDFPEVSPLKIPFPTVNVPKETPLPAIDSFKKPYPLVNAVYYDLQAQHNNYDTLYTPTNSLGLINNNLMPNTLETRDDVPQATAETTSTPTANCLIVLENKILSQDEMIDLTELRLSNSNTPRFINPHKPIPELVIKQENTDEYPATNTPPATVNPNQETALIPTEQPKVTTAENKEIPCEKVVISNGQNRKIIINAQKLKLPPEQLADLAKKIKARTAVTSAATKLNPKLDNKSSDIRILNTKAANRKVLTPFRAKHTAYVLPQNNAKAKDNPEVMTSQGSYIINNKQNFNDPYKEDHNYQLKSTQQDIHANKASMETSEADLSKAADESLIQVKEEPKTLENNVKSPTNLLEETANTSNSQEASSFMDTTFTDYRKSAVEIIDEPMDTEDSFSAVDFITALNNTNPITEETSLELSPEELNLNASCTMNNFSPLRIQSYPQQRHRTTSATFKAYATNNEQMSTIVIESSKGPETILTNESPNKYGALQKVKLLNNLAISDRDLEKPEENSKEEASGCRKQQQQQSQQLVLEPLKEPKNIDLTDVIVATDPNKIKLIISQVSNTDVAASPNKKKSPSKSQTLETKSLDKCQESIDLITCEVGETVASNLSKQPSESSEKVEEAKEHSANENNTTETNQLKDTKDSKSERNPITCLANEPVKTPLKVTNLKSILKSPITDAEQNSDNSNSGATNECVITNPSEVDSSINSRNSQQAAGESEPTKASETATTSSSNTVTTKRISRFKKGKINLVPRNKASSQSANKPAKEEKKNEVIKQEIEVNKDTKSEESAKEGNRSGNEMVKQSEISENNEKPSSVTTIGGSPSKSSAKTPTKSQQLQMELEKDEKPNSQIGDLALNVTTTTTDKEILCLKDNSKENTDKSNDSVTKPKAIESVICLDGNEEDSCNIFGHREVVSEAIPTEISLDINQAVRSPVKSCSNEKPSKSPQKRKTQQEGDQLKDFSEVTPQKVKVTNSEINNEPDNVRNSPEKHPKSSETSEISTPQKSPQDIARKLDFEAEMETENVLEQEQPKGSITTDQGDQQSKDIPVEVFQQTVNTLNNYKELQQTPTKSICTANPNEEMHLTESVENLIEINEIQDNIENISCENNTLTQSQLVKNEDLDQGSRYILNNMRNAKVSLIDIVKHSPIKTPDIKPVIPFKKKTTETKEHHTETKGIQSLIKQLKCHNQEEKEAKETQVGDKPKEIAEEPESSAKATRRSLTKVNDENQNSSIVSCKRSSRLSLAEKPAATAVSKPNSSNRKRHSTRPLISDDDLEFLPVNAEVKFKLSKTKHNDKDNEEATSLTTPTLSDSLSTRRTRLYSKPLDMELTKHSSPMTKRTRYYSQTLETNVTISFDALKSDTTSNVAKPLNRLNLKPLDTEDSCHDSTQDSNKLTPTKQRKKLRKTLEDIKKSQKSHTDTDSEDERDYDDSCLKDCEEGSEFLGFEDNNDTSFKTTPPAIKQHESKDKLGKTKGGTMKNWLTTGKAIAPTLEPEQPIKRIEETHELPATSPRRSSNSGGIKPFKKRWDLTSSNRNEETDITDDTSPADDEDESAAEQQIPTTNTRKFKRGIKNVIDSNKELLDSKKLKLDEIQEHSFIKPRHLRAKSKNSGTDSESHDEKTSKNQQSRLRIKNFQEHMAISTNAKESANDSDCPMSTPKAKANLTVKAEENVKESSATDSDYTERRSSRRSRCQVKDVDKLNNETSGTDSDWHEGKATNHTKSKIQTNNTSRETHSGNSAVNSDGQDKTKLKQQKKSKAKDLELEEKNNLEKVKQSEQDSDNHEGRGTKRLQTKTKAKDVDKSLKSYNSETECSAKRESTPLKSKSKTENTQNINDLQKEADKGVTPKTDRKESESVKSKSKNSESDCGKGKKSKHLKSKLMTDDDDTEQKLDVPVKLEKADMPKNKENLKSSKKSSKEADKESQKAQGTNRADSSKDEQNIHNADSSKHEKSIPNEISTTDLEYKTQEISSPATKTSKNKTSKKKTEKKTRKVKTQTAAHTPTIEQNTKDTPTSSVNKSLKRSLSTDSSDDELPTPTAKKRATKNQTKRKLKIEDYDSDSTATPSKTDDGKDNNIDNLTPISTPHLALVKNETPKRKGRKPKVNGTECNFNSRLLLITKREQLDTDEVLTETMPGNGPIQCGLCLGRTAKWTLHLAEHYGVGWQVGQEKLNVENRTVVLNCIVNYLKNTGSKGLSCRMCKKEYRSGLGMLMHIEACGAKVSRVICEYCKRDYAPSTLITHVRSCYAKIELENPSAEVKLEENSEKTEEVFGNTGRLKRNSTIKAETKLKVLGEELEKVGENTKNEKSNDIDPKSRIRYVAPIHGESCTKKWSQDIEKLGKAACPKKRCKFSANNLKELSEHLKTCKLNKSGYFCNFCRQRAFKTEKEAIEHVIKNHKGGRARKKSDDFDCELKTDDEQSSDENDLSEGVDENEIDSGVSEEEEDEYDETPDCSRKGRKKITKKPYNRNPNQISAQSIRKQVFDGRFTDLNKEVLTKWKSFLKQNYSIEPLYGEFTNQYSVVNQQDFKKYLPKQTVSMKFNFKPTAALSPIVGEPQTDIEWSELKRYETIHNKLDTYFFVGAPVKLCSWLPLPAHVNEQYLAVVYRQDMFKFIKFSQPKQHHTIILILKVTQNNQKAPLMQIHYGLVVPDGPVHHVSFLPSGGYDECSNRLGLVAVATVSSTIKIYSLPLNVKENVATTDSSNDNEDITLIEVKPSFNLTLNLIHQQQQHVLFNTQCLQICWSEFAGHQHIFASFANGFIGIWDITNDLQENLNRFVVDEIINYAPLNYIYVGEKRVKCFAIHYDSSGPRWLAAAGAYRKFLIFDIKSFMQPIVMKEDVNKNILLSMDWCPLWETLLYSYCDVIPNNGRCVMTVNPTNVMFPQNKLDSMVCGVTQVHYTPVTNMCVTALDNGDVVFLETKELHYECPLSKKFGERRMLYAMDVKQLDGQPLVQLPKKNEKNVSAKIPKEWSLHDDNYKEKYGLVFEPLLKLKEEYKNIYLSEQRCPPCNVIPLMRINSLRCNLNLNAKNLIALGYENGFLRLVNFNKEKDIL